MSARDEYPSGQNGPLPPCGEIQGGAAIADATYPGPPPQRGEESPIGTRVLYPDGRMKQAQSGTTRSPAAGPRWGREPAAPRLFRSSDERLTADLQAVRPAPAWSWGRMIVALLGAVWFALALPFRLVFGTIAW